VSDQVDVILGQWARERPDLDTSPMGIVGRISRLARSYDQAIAATLGAFGLRPDEFDLLATLRRHGPPHELCPRHLMASMMVSSGTTTHRLDKLEARGLVKRRPDPGDRRGVLARLTPEGKRLVDAAVEAHVAGEKRLLEPLGSADRERLASLLRRLALPGPIPRSPPGEGA
jgi:DNA-binding MarR family transcriptional regulator